MVAREFPFSCDAWQASWEVYHPHFVARQLGYLQGCLVPLLTSCSLSRERLSGSSQRECEEVEQDFQERCGKFSLLPNAPETHGTSTFTTSIQLMVQAITVAKPVVAPFIETFMAQTSTIHSFDEVELEAYFACTSRTTGISVALAESNALTKLQKTLFLSAL
ncbi:hypothetical protein D8674_004342 [Pyrus ussuriensis x Pyrus communis]|uniref:Uncharacterized protein n=1 Tax=Pyrus ussuriensis x Pyrus communis TaxID=2448454 RepID=A0A5N5FK72_9ROSA|nr:hypothetical protein D8674_004342 [Pyrus ussuriensis x Pyrus communis]